MEVVGTNGNSFVRSRKLRSKAKAERMCKNWSKRYKPLTDLRVVECNEPDSPFPFIPKDSQ